MHRQKFALACAAILLAGVCTGCNKLKARDQINKGVIAFKNAQFAQAIDHFERAASYDPTLLDARLYLATALSQQYVSGGTDAANIQMANRAIQAYQNVLKMQPNNTTAIGSIGNLYYEMHNFDQAKVYQQKLMKIEPNDPDPYYWIGVLDWFPCYRRDVALRTKLNLTRPKNPAHPGDLPPLPKKDREALTAQNDVLVDEGIQNLNKAIALKPNYANAYSYLNLLYRQKADLESDPDARTADLQKANDLGSKALALMKAAAAAKAKKANAS
ncbi:MAG: tetratricopeptide repeat protein [Terriglobia bacterium]